MTVDIAMKITGLFVGLFIIGTLLCLPIFNWNIRSLIASKLWVKICWWIPIFMGFMAVLFIGSSATIIVSVAIILQGLREFFHNKGYGSRIATIYLIGFVIATLHLSVFFHVADNHQAITGLIVVCFASVLSDVFAYFFGTYFGKTPLPTWINPKKSWEGVAGQIAGALFGYFLLFITLGETNLWILALGIGVASAIGDLANSIAKRSLTIKDWGQTIPGHGGVLDRFSSLSMAIAFTVWILFL